MNHTPLPPDMTLRRIWTFSGTKWHGDKHYLVFTTSRGTNAVVRVDNVINVLIGTDKEQETCNLEGALNMETGSEVRFVVTREQVSCVTKLFCPWEVTWTKVPPTPSRLLV